MTIYRGIMPDPESMQEYENLLPGFTERILAMTEEEGKHRRAIEKSIIASNRVLALCGIASALLSVLVITALCFYAFYLGHPIQAAAIAIGVIAALAGTFLYRKQTKPEQEEARTRE